MSIYRLCVVTLFGLAVGCALAGEPSSGEGASQEQAGAEFRLQAYESFAQAGYARSSRGMSGRARGGFSLSLTLLADKPALFGSVYTPKSSKPSLTLSRVVDDTGKNLLPEDGSPQIEINKSEEKFADKVALKSVRIGRLLFPAAGAKRIDVIEGVWEAYRNDRSDLKEVTFDDLSGLIGKENRLQEPVTLKVLVVEKDRLQVLLTPEILEFADFFQFTLLDKSGAKLADFVTHSYSMSDPGRPIWLRSKVAIPEGAKLKVVYPAKLRRVAVPFRFTNLSLEFPATPDAGERSAKNDSRPTAANQAADPGCHFTVDSVFLRDLHSAKFQDNQWCLRTTQGADLDLRVSVDKADLLWKDPSSNQRGEVVKILQAVDDTGRDLLAPVPGRSLMTVYGEKREGRYNATIGVHLALPDPKATRIALLRGEMSLLGLAGTRKTERKVDELKAGDQVDLGGGYTLQVRKISPKGVEVSTDLPAERNGVALLYDRDGKLLARSTVVRPGERELLYGPLEIAGGRLEVLYGAENLVFELKDIPLKAEDAGK